MVVRDTFVDVNDGDQLNDGYFNEARSEILDRNFFDWFDDSDSYDEWDVPDGSFDTAKWDYDYLPTESATSIYWGNSIVAPATETKNNTIATKNTIPTNRKAYHISIGGTGTILIGGGAGASLRSGLQFHFAGVDYEVFDYTTGSGGAWYLNYQTGNSYPRHTFLAKRTATNTYDIYVDGYKVASSVSAASPVCGITANNKLTYTSSGSMQTNIASYLYHVRYSKD